MIHILIKEFNGFLNTLIAYVVIGVFLSVIGLLMWVFPQTSVLDYGYADMDTLFSIGPYVFIFLIPAITMKSFAEEKKMGTLEFLFTKPLSIWEVLGGKFLAAFALVLLSLTPTMVYCWSIYQLGEPRGNLDVSGIIGSYIGLILLSTVFCAIGIFSSAMTTNQIVSFVMGAILSLAIYSGFESFSLLIANGAIALQVKQMGILYHYQSMSRGLIDSRDLIYFLSVAGLILLITKTILSSRQW